MKLSEIKNIPILSKSEFNTPKLRSFIEEISLQEIQKIGQIAGSTFKLPDTAIHTGKTLGKSDGREIFAVSFSDDSKTHFAFFNKDDLGVSSFVIVNETSIDERDVAEVVRSWTRKDLQNKGYLSAILKFIKDHTQMSLMSDKEQTSDGQLLWKNLSKKFDVKMIDLFDGTLNDIDDDTLYSKPTDRYRLFIESYLFVPGVGKVSNKQKNLQEQIDPILTPYIYFEDGDA